jgi:L-serine dehydratase
MVSTFEIFRVGIGPSSSHTVGPMRAARRFVADREGQLLLPAVARVRCELYGSLAATGLGHGTPRALILGLMGERPEQVDPEQADSLVDDVRSEGRLLLMGTRAVQFDEARDVVFDRSARPGHPNALRLTALDERGDDLQSSLYFSIGGGVITQPDRTGPPVGEPEASVEFPFTSGAELLSLCAHEQLSISDVIMRNELAWRSEPEIRSGLLDLWNAMQSCIERGCVATGVLPGALAVPRRAAAMHHELTTTGSSGDPLGVLDWLSVFALAVNEENAAGGRVVTAPTNGAAGIVPAVLAYYRRFVHTGSDTGTVRFLLAAAAIAMLCKANASILGADVGCQGEVGSASAMAAAGLTEAMGGSPAQVENAAEIALEHCLGLTCDPVGGLVQIPCIERNAVGAVKAVTAARIALRGDGRHRVSLDAAIDTMRETGADMLDKYKETALGGLAVNVVEC